ncbi:histone acetyltransferase (RNA polymerase elongator complex component) [Peptostreptococcus canis]|nr:radical SAM protein [Peptostreptococcus canis]MBP1998826.1 histone acetyltransferase (RNA polymerase elongator complex component) [Peptostreptococcus canis]
MKKIIPIFVPHQGCPHDCIFCNQKKITGVSTDMTGEKTRMIIEEALKTIPNSASIEIAFFGGSFTAIDKNKQVELLSVANEYKKKGIVDDIRMSTRPDCIDEDILKLVKKYGTTIIELGVQSMDEGVLKSSIRGHNSDIVEINSRLIKSFGFKLGLQMMIGLPTDTESKCIYTARQFAEISPDFVRIYPTLVIKETGLERAYVEGWYKPFSIKECIDIVKKIITIYEKANIEVIRVGLQATKDIQPGRDVIAGPYHPSFRELVKTEMIKDYLIDVIGKRSFENIVIYTDNKNISAVVGNKKSTRKFINNEYNAKFKTVTNAKLLNKMVIEIDGIIIDTVSFNNMYLRLGEIYNL